MNNSFARFGISHLSMSHLNLWRAAPKWSIRRYVLKIKDETNPSMERGNAVEAGFVAYLRGSKEPLAIAYQNFDSKTEMLPKDDEWHEERDRIAPMLDECLKWKPPGMLNAAQIRIEHWIDPIPIPFIGYIDLAFDPVDVDLKSVKACPSSPSPPNNRQVALYRAARNNKPGALLYVTAKKHAYYEISDEDMNAALEEIRDDALSLNNYLARCDTKEDAWKSLPADWDNYRAPKTKVPLSELLMGG